MSPARVADTRIVSIPALVQRSGQGAHFRRSVRVWQAVVICGLAVFALHAGFGVGGPTGDRVVGVWLYFLLEALALVAVVARAILVPDERAAWAWLAAGIAAYSIGDVIWTLQGYAPGPTIADPLYLFFYPAAYIALLLLVRSRLSHFNRSVWLDGISVSLAVGALGAAFLLELALDHTEGSTLAVATNRSAGILSPCSSPCLDHISAAFSHSIRDHGRSFGFSDDGTELITVTHCLCVHEAGC